MGLKGLLFVFGVVLLSDLAMGAQCPPCGNTTVPYPLSTSPSCGQPGYPVVCTPSNQLQLEAVSGSYPIKSINPHSQILVIDSAPLLSDHSCITSDLSNGGLVLNSSLQFNVSSSNTVMLLNCSSALLLSPLNCSSSSLCHEYVQNTPSASACGSSLCCTFRAGGSSTNYVLKVSYSNACTAYVSVVNLNPTVSPSGWDYGVALDWSVPREPLCSSRQPCTGNSTCSPDPTSNVSRCFCNKGLQWDPSSGNCITGVCGSDGEACPGSGTHTRLIAGLTSALGGALIVSIIFLVVYLKLQAARQAKINRAKHLAELMSAHGGGVTAKVFTAGEMKRATNSFSRARVLGSGGFGEVFKGILDDGTLVAIKAAKVGNIQSQDHVINEVCILSQVNHRNLVRLLGVCVDMDVPLLVYEFVPNGALYDHLRRGGGGKGELNLDWKTRIRIAHQTAEGLAYLHSAAYPPIYHRDVKSSNILLDENLNAKVSDFGLSRLAKPDLSHVSTCAQGTLGYLDPEYYRNYQLTDKSDVYSFGVVLLEIITSQRAIDFSRDHDDVNLAIYVMNKSESGHSLDVIDPYLVESASSVVKDSILAAILLALSCVQESRANRPTMKEVADELQYIASIEDLDLPDQYEEKLAR